MAEKRKRRNLKIGFTTDMKVFGRKVRRVGLLVTLTGGGLMSWRLSELREQPSPTPAAKAASPAVSPADAQR
jgi:hypothetical protein